MSYYVYQITGAGMTYYGSSMRLCSDRRDQHTSQYRCHHKAIAEGRTPISLCSSYKIFDATDDWVMEIIESGIETEYEALYAENECINNNECVNINNALALTGEALKEYKTKWVRHDRLRRGITPLIPIPNQSEEVTKAKRKSLCMKYHEEHHEELKQKGRERYAQKEFTEEDRRKEYDRVEAYRQANMEKVTASKKEYYEKTKNDPEFVAKQKAYYQANKEVKCAQRKEHYEANKESIQARRKELAQLKKLKQEIGSETPSHLYPPVEEDTVSL